MIHFYWFVIWCVNLLMFILQKVHNIWSKLTVTGVSAKQSVEIVHRVLGETWKLYKDSLTLWFSPLCPPPPLKSWYTASKNTFPPSNYFFRVNQLLQHIFENHFCRCPVFFYLFLTNLIEIGTLTLAQISNLTQLGKRKTFSINTLFSRGGCDKLAELKSIFMGCVHV